MNAVLDRLRAQRSEQVTFIDQTLARVESESRDLVQAETDNLTASRDRIRELDAQIAPLEEFEQLRGAHDSTASHYRPAAGGGTQDAGDQSRGQGTGLGARTQPRGHEYQTRGEVIVDIIKAAGQHERGAGPDRSAVDRLVGAGVRTGATDDQIRALSNEITSDVPGLIPKPIVGQVINDLDASRPFVSSIGAKDLGVIPGKTFSRPVVTQHTTVGKQTAEKSELPSQKYVVGGVDFTKETYGGALDVSRQTMDWTSPGAWDALLADLQDVYGIQTETVAATAFAAAVTTEVELAGATGSTPTIDAIISGMYGAAAGVYGDVQRLPNHMWLALDQWATVGAAVDKLKATSAGSGGGSGSVSAFEGNLIGLPRTIVPSLPAGTIIIGVKERTEFYEERIGLLTAVEPRLLGVEIAYGGYIAYGTIKPTAFRKLVNKV